VEVVEEVLGCLQLIGEGREAELRERIPEEGYLTNFVALAHQVAPDGKDVTQVGFTAGVGPGLQVVALRRPLRESVPGLVTPPASDEASRRIVGELRFADSISEAKRIKVLPEDGRPVSVWVPEGMMHDIVRPMYEDTVAVDMARSGGKWWLRDIRRVEP
jgi:hypothetical protein